MNFVCYKDIPFTIKTKGIYIKKITKKGIRKTYRGFHYTDGTLPVCAFNDITKKAEPVVNLSGNAYIYRKDIKHYKRKKYEQCRNNLCNQEY